MRPARAANCRRALMHARYRRLFSPCRNAYAIKLLVPASFTGSDVAPDGH